LKDTNLSVFIKLEKRIKKRFSYNVFYEISTDIALKAYYSMAT